MLETLIAIVVLMIGLLAVLATFALAVGNTTSMQNDSHRPPESGGGSGKHLHRAPNQPAHV